MRDPRGRLPTAGAHEQRQQRRAGRAIDIVVAVDEDAFTLVDRLRQTCGGAFHAQHGLWLVQVAQAVGEPLLGLIRALDATQGEQSGGQATDTQVVLQLGDHVVGWLAAQPRAIGGQAHRDRSCRGE